jgi:hypothetical protein
VLKGLIDRHAIDPGANLGPTGELANLSKHLEEHLLGDVGGILDADHSYHQSIHVLVRGFVQPVLRSMIALLTILDDLGELL